MALLDAFIGVPQSKIAAFAILVAIAVVALAVVLGDISVPPAYRLLTVVFMVLMSIPSVLVTLVNITCTVSGAAGDKWWCDIWAWVLTGFVAFYSVLLIIAAFMVMSNKASMQKDGAARAGILVANQAAEGFFEGEVEPQPEEAGEPVETANEGIMNVSDFPETGVTPVAKPVSAAAEQGLPEPFEVEAPVFAPLTGVTDAIKSFVPQM